LQVSWDWGLECTVSFNLFDEVEPKAEGFIPITDNSGTVM